MQTRREFLQDAAFWAGAIGMPTGLISSIQRAVAIEPAPGTTFRDAEHVVILMQENRSFDHVYGTLSGVRGFNDPRAVKLPDGNPVFVQKDTEGRHFAPWRLNLLGTKSTWMGCLPHGWTDQVDAANGGLHDQWLPTKQHPAREYARMPLTMGYYNREDLPFYHALADAFTVCDYNFCSSLTGTTPNRLHLMTGTIRERPTADSPALVRNSDCDYGNWRDWRTFPELLEDHGVDWRIYQNEVNIPSGLSGQAKPWLGNYGDNPIEWFTQFNARFHPGHHDFLTNKARGIETGIKNVTEKLKTAEGEEKSKLNSSLKQLNAQLAQVRTELESFAPEKFDQLSEREKSLHSRALTTNSNDVHYRELQDLTFEQNGKSKTVSVPRGDVLYQFRKDVAEGKLPTVSWLVAPERFCDHPSSAWYGQWYLSEVLNILTSNPDVWKKTVFILTYNENDGYYDHIPPFQAPHPRRPETGRTSSDIDTTVEFVELEQDRAHFPQGGVRGNSIGLGYRVPMVIASPWSRGGCVCSEVYDHTSVIRFVEELLSHKLNKPIREENISTWRRTVCGDLTAAFQSKPIPESGLQNFLNRDEYIQQILGAADQDIPTGFKALTEAELTKIRNGQTHPLLPRQEPGTRPSSPLPYELEVNGKLNADKSHFTLAMAARNQRFGERASGAPFIVYADTKDGLKARHYAVSAGNSIEEHWPLSDFPGGQYSLRVHGPNGFYREFHGKADSPSLEIQCLDQLPKQVFHPQRIALRMKAGELATPVTLQVKDNAYGQSFSDLPFATNSLLEMTVDVSKSARWYDFTISVKGHEPFTQRFAGRLENGEWSTSDPAMAGNASSLKNSTPG